MQRSRDFEDFYAANYGKIAALAAAVTGDRHEAHDITQEAFARALARWPGSAATSCPRPGCGRSRCGSPSTPPRRIRRTLRAAPLLRAASRPAAPEPGDGLAFTALGLASSTASSASSLGEIDAVFTAAPTTGQATSYDVTVTPGGLGSADVTVAPVLLVSARHRRDLRQGQRADRAVPVTLRAVRASAGSGPARTR